MKQRLPLRQLPSFLLYLLLFFSQFFSNKALAQFTSGNVVVLQAGTGVSSLTNTGNPILLREYSPTGTASSTVTVPSSGNNPLIISGSASSEGLLTRSSDGTRLVFGGYAQTLPNTVQLASATAASVNRAIGTVDQTGTFSRVASSSTFHSANNIRAAASDGASNYWSAGGNDGTDYFGSGTPATVQNVKVNTRAVAVFNGNLYFSTQSAAGSAMALGIYQVGAGLPTTAGQSITTTINTGTGSQPAGFFFNAAGTVCYIADGRATSSGGGIQKWTFDGTTWALAYTFGTGTSSTVGTFGIAVDFSGTDPVIYATTTEATANRLVKVTDTGSTATVSTIATAPANTSFRGVASAPAQQAPPALPDLTVSLSAPASATLNQPFNYSLVVSNSGSVNVSGVTAQFTLPTSTSVTYNSAVVGNGFTASQVNGVVTFSGGSLTAGTGTLLTVTVTPTVTGTVVSGTALVDPSNTIAESNETNNAAAAVSTLVTPPATGTIRITEFAYSGAGAANEFIELTNVGNAPVDLTGWSFDDSSEQPGSFSIGAFGTVQPGESVIIAEATAAVFRRAWYLPSTAKVIGSNNQNLGNGDELNIYDANNALVDRLTYPSSSQGGSTVYTNGVSAWVPQASLGTNTIANWVLSVVNDVQNSYASVDGNVGNPGGYFKPLNRVLVRESNNSTNVAEGGATDTYTIALNSQPTAQVVVTLTPDAQLTTNVASLTFTPSSFSVAQTVTVTAVDDNVVEGTHTGLITHSASSTDPAYNGIVINPVSATITDNDLPATAAPTISVASTTTAFLSASAVSGVISDPTDPARTLGIDFTLADADTPVNNLSVTVGSSNAGVVPAANLSLTGNGSSRNLKITPAGVGYTTIAVTVSDGTNATSYSISYAASAASTSTSRFHTGSSDASTAQAIDANYMLVGDDENQVLRLYDRNNSGLPLAGFDYTSSLGLTDISGGVPREVDIEASVRIGNRIYWLGSHSNASSGGARPNRSRLFATDLSGSGAATTLSYVGRYDGLKTDLINWDVNNGHGLGANYFGFQAGAADGVAPEAGNGVGFNIEGLTVAPDGVTGYIAFRAPISPASNRTKALIVPVTNFTALVSGNPTTGPASFGAPILLDLGGRGIREIKGNGNGQYLIVAGPSGGAGGDPNAFKLFTWTGKPTDAAVLRSADLSGLSGTNGDSSIESIVDLPASLTDNSIIQFLMDTGDKVYYNDGIAAKDLTQPNFKKSRSDVARLGASNTDLTATLFLDNLSFSDTGVTRDFVVSITEVNNLPTSGPIAFKIAKPTAFTITYSTTDGTSNVQNGLKNTNGSWSFSEDDNYITVQTNTAFTAFGGKIVGFSIARKPGTPVNTLQSLNVTILPNAGSEQNFANNVAVTTVTTN